MADSHHDEVLTKILVEEGGSVPSFLNAIFGFLARHCPDEMYSSSRISGEHLISQSYCRWRQKYLEEKTEKSMLSLHCSDGAVPIAVAEEVVISEEPNIKNDVIETVSKGKPGKKDDIFNNFNTANGAVRGSYAWTQSVEDLEVRVSVSDNVRKGKQVKVNLQSNHLEVEVQEASTWQLLISGDLPHTIKTEESVWSLTPGDQISINLEKTEEQWWDRLFTHEDQIDLKNINAERDISTLPEEDQQKIQEMVWNKQQQEQGKPTSDQLRLEKMLRDAWTADGSPFLGQPYDPSAINFTSGSNFNT